MRPPKSCQVLQALSEPESFPQDLQDLTRLTMLAVDPHCKPVFELHFLFFWQLWPSVCNSLCGECHFCACHLGTRLQSMHRTENAHEHEPVHGEGPGSSGERSAFGAIAKSPANGAGTFTVGPSRTRTRTHLFTPAKNAGECPKCHPARGRRVEQSAEGFFEWRGGLSL